MLTPIKIGVSSCLLGNKVRYDGGHSHDRFLTQTLGLFAGKWANLLHRGKMMNFLI
ncbi:hypothetical protein [Desulfobacula sp.]|jgi:uncharacterized protein YbbK (DUF523 family)|uniref:hypothetical protein n=1 Tax=Desulfobacula sp. TaxID=2593537 RepID=UPI0039B8A6F3